MEQTSPKTLKSLMLIGLVIIIAGCLLFSGNHTIALALLVIGGLTLMWSSGNYLRSKVADQAKWSKYTNYFLIIAGSIILLLGIAVYIFERENFKENIYSLIVGFVLLGVGIYKLKKKQPAKTN